MESGYTSFLIDTDVKVVMTVFQNRNKNMLQPIHLVATLINPSHQGASLSTEEYIDATKFIYNVSLSRDIDTKVVLSDITNYKTKSFGFCEKNVFENQLILWNLNVLEWFILVLLFLMWLQLFYPLQLHQPPRTLI